ncbi:hypothetical protein PDIG_03660 [Penicillium digitatum PHI26]|uniref:Uncharacterized protein n=2 Tax=Penicillium digitatum TaxID=36651 RepID=K9H218_PEND2|nr:hypothetical protein PDIP_08340 [Penicillium digitatum Pd1]EKV19206.1 hypothetical protein PDIG_03660 [Penicillium digitatum PHI26]EKV21261.1 hypothetical protein PDIP_08340 [Penicillium digitatum Pd1]
MKNVEGWIKGQFFQGVFKCKEDSENYPKN